MQSAREAVDNVVRGKKADHVPLHDSPWGDAVTKWVTQGMPKNEKGEAVDCADHFGFDMVGCGGWFDWVAKRGPEQIVEENEEWKIVRNGNGAALKWWKKKSGTPEHIDFHMNSRAIWEKEYRPHLAGTFDRTRVGDIAKSRENLEQFRKKGKWGYYGHQFIWENLRASLGDKLAFVGGFDARILETGDHALIRREVRKFMRGMKKRGARFLFGSDHSVSTNVNYDAFCCALEAYREEMTY